MKQKCTVIYLTLHCFVEHCLWLKFGFLCVVAEYSNMLAPMFAPCIAVLCLHMCAGHGAKDNCSSTEAFEVNTLFQIKHPGDSLWKTSRDLAYIDPPQNFTLGPLGNEMKFTIISAVPTFGPQGNYIALILNHNIISVDPDHPSAAYADDWYVKLRDYVQRNLLFCAGPNGSHVANLRLKGHLLCDWPTEDSHQETFEVSILDVSGTTLGTITARQTPDLLEQYHTVACVRDVYWEDDNPEFPFSGPFKQLVEWLEFNLLHGVDHFFIYTFAGTETASADVLMPYLNTGKASRIHFNDYPERSFDRFKNLYHDCLYRAKNHAKWLLPTVDFDEYIRMVSGDIFGGVVPENYLNSMWDAFLEHENFDRKDVQTISFDRYRFARSKKDELEISSRWRESTHQRVLHGKNATDYSGSDNFANPKFALNVDTVYDLWNHGASFADKGTVLLHMPDSIAVANHYRTAYGAKYDGSSMEDPMANHFDEGIFHDVPKIERALTERFGEDLQTILKRLSGKRPPESYSVSAGL